MHTSWKKLKESDKFLYEIGARQALGFDTKLLLITWPKKLIARDEEARISSNREEASELEGLLGS